jgi:hypothetical protein
MEVCAQLHTPAALTQMSNGLVCLSIGQDALGKANVFLLSCYGKFFGLTFLSVDL